MSSPATTQEEITSFEHAGENVHLIDIARVGLLHEPYLTIGKIENWLSSAHNSNVGLSGIICLNGDRLFPPSGFSMHEIKELMVQLMEELNPILRSTVIVTASNKPFDREKQMFNIFWQPMLELGVRVAQYDESRSSALSIIDMFMPKESTHRITDQWRN